jgi:hypothetical protein
MTEISFSCIIHCMNFIRLSIVCGNTSFVSKQQLESGVVSY